ncbi:MAG: bifunctional riboflavin kinase/FAD synthetase [Clostridium sp.]|jgi:riboflavin kinase/FMN adenylyltransferase|uniref:bifunctional riboflavin kinase/FAD synthetase n=1 Tax=Clostridium sp. TaxID=1506 RepID=UPI0025C4ACFC|nr:bifunctional riboflavin kinase/FAD synthetase [Clostridium sp.]MCH3963978.1 bifunctional riboflavin kinase/FAD synthetase [Clostridium sp.]MCI1716179.1 bifunctional riboflavin kinase/FAD synthetase [Clostridium sp.]MCI1800581.1 bifunctional riboflavin kinase/FAD synthetase [Clostridium sp.]MCI1814356.1 bifunctional riboflavin kinase/FAD synthetase [Clostridium sp.]MCI1871255.1 bifunctional riboflavin kinase/FAD synthetase [Clostridium sp.]
MIVIEDNFKTYLEEKTYIALGSFDGLHLGHMRLVEKAIDLAKKNNAKSMVFTFKFHPRAVINKNAGPKILMSNENKLEVLKNTGLDIINMANFNSEFMKMSSEDFVVNLIKNYNALGIVVGFNYKFGYKNMGNINLLRKLSLKYGFSLDVIPPVKYEDKTVSSSLIRETISEMGDMKRARDMLTRPFMMCGSVIQGKHLGKKLGFPTANISFNKKFLVPKEGVYFTIVKLNSKYYRGITNVGYNPTTNDNALSVETNILDFSGDVYDKKLSIYFIERIRDEIKFKTLDGLIKQLEHDRDYAYSKSLKI